ncbi:50S ribosome-binding protein YggL [Roseateles koreensis]|uniref:50S ribosome-binding protein YggL n=1 Tax=Roseateles koreensis TaxID=2987526 RepID=A0ABT5KSS3_9BURK|nr:50S ribosome-binding protein YggL [Roseateles koreensis]MDC8785987.1 50S ribosome-binding protein YggL [Roseateles koreensis]
MSDLLVLPPPKRSRSRRLRKKLRIGEFQELGFEYELTWRVTPSIDVQDRFIDRLLDEVIKPRSLSLGGGVNCGFVTAHRGNVTDTDRAAFDSWVRRWTDLTCIEVGPLRDAWYDEVPRLPASRPKTVSDFENAGAKAALLDKLGRMIEESGGVWDRAALSAWLDTWLAEPLPELGGTTPAQVLVTRDGRRQVETILERMRGGLPG